MEVEIIIIAIVGLLGGAGISWFVMKKAMDEKLKLAREKAIQIVKEAETKAEVMKKDKMLEAKEKFLQLKAEHERHITEKNKAIANAENNNGAKVETLVVKEAVAGTATSLKRIVPKARGSMGPIIKRNCHIKIVLSDNQE